MELQANDAENNNVNIIKTEEEEFVPDPRGLGYVLFNILSSNKNNIAQVDGITGEKETYGQVLQRSVRAAIEMKARNVTSNDIISLCSHNTLDSSIPFYAVQFLGAKIASFDPTLSSTDTVHLLKQVTPKMIFVDEASLPLFEESLKEADLKAEIVVFGETESHTPFSAFLQESQEEDHFKPYETEDVMDTAIILFSSGTTGLAKGICTSHYAILSQTIHLIKGGWNFRVSLLFSTLYWISSILLLCSVALSGGIRIVMKSFNCSTIWSLIPKYDITFMFFSPSLVVALNKNGRPADADTTSLSDVLIGGASVSKEQMLDIRELFPGANVLNIYGQTEVAGCVTSFKPANREDILLSNKYPGSCGTPINGLWYKIVDSDTEEILGANKGGELRIKTKMAMNGYYHLDSSASWDDEGWLKTGDIVYYNEDHCFFALDRIKEVIKFQSYHVLPAFLESVLLTHPDVKSAVVIGIPHEEDGEHPMGLVVLCDPRKDVSPEQIIKYVEERVSDRQRLRAGVLILDSIPTTPSGKYRRREIKNKIIRGEL